eukprot:GDKJ01002915.1.p1 GENE.GDKJ01002915.1~~GDKJ01002915.1.p1  ORF type:complete len:632 (-),score=122.20 GDKJ01002915.1:82-1977(-)
MLGRCIEHYKTGQVVHFSMRDPFNDISTHVLGVEDHSSFSLRSCCDIVSEHISTHENQSFPSHFDFISDLDDNISLFFSRYCLPSHHSARRLLPNLNGPILDKTKNFEKGLDFYISETKQMIEHNFCLFDLEIPACTISHHFEEEARVLSELIRSDQDNLEGFANLEAHIAEMEKNYRATARFITIRDHLSQSVAVRELIHWSSLKEKILYVCDRSPYPLSHCEGLIREQLQVASHPLWPNVEGLDLHSMVSQYNIAVGVSKLKSWANDMDWRQHRKHAVLFLKLWIALSSLDSYCVTSNDFLFGLSKQDLETLRLNCSFPNTGSDAVFPPANCTLQNVDDLFMRYLTSELTIHGVAVRHSSFGTFLWNYLSILKFLEGWSSEVASKLQNEGLDSAKFTAGLVDWSKWTDETLLLEKRKEFAEKHCRLSALEGIIETMVFDEKKRMFRDLDFSAAAKDLDGEESEKSKPTVESFGFVTAVVFVVLTIVLICGGWLYCFFEVKSANAASIFSIFQAISFPSSSRQQYQQANRLLTASDQSSNDDEDEKSYNSSSRNSRNSHQNKIKYRNEYCREGQSGQSSNQENDSQDDRDDDDDFSGSSSSDGQEITLLVTASSCHDRNSKKGNAQLQSQ